MLMKTIWDLKRTMILLRQHRSSATYNPKKKRSTTKRTNQKLWTTTFAACPRNCYMLVLFFCDHFQMLLSLLSYLVMIVSFTVFVSDPIDAYSVMQAAQKAMSLGIVAHPKAKECYKCGQGHIVRLSHFSNASL